MTIEPTVWIDNIRTNEPPLTRCREGFARRLQAHMSIAKDLFTRGSTMKFMVLATNGAAKQDAGPWSIARSRL